MTELTKEDKKMLADVKSVTEKMIQEENLDKELVMASLEAICSSALSKGDLDRLTKAMKSTEGRFLKQYLAVSTEEEREGYFIFDGGTYYPYGGRYKAVENISPTDKLRLISSGQMTTDGKLIANGKPLDKEKRVRNVVGVASFEDGKKFFALTMFDDAASNSSIELNKLVKFHSKAPVSAENGVKMVTNTVVQPTSYTTTALASTTILSTLLELFPSEYKIESIASIDAAKSGNVFLLKAFMKAKTVATPKKNSPSELRYRISIVDTVSVVGFLDAKIAEAKGIDLEALNADEFEPKYLLIRNAHAVTNADTTTTTFVDVLDIYPSSTPKEKPGKIFED